MHFCCFWLLSVFIFLSLIKKAIWMNERRKKEVNTLLHILTEKTTVNTIQIQCLLLPDGTKPLNNIHNHYWNNCFTDSIESSFDWFDSPSQVKRKKKSKNKEQSEFWHHDVIWVLVLFYFDPRLTYTVYSILEPIGSTSRTGMGRSIDSLE